MHVMVKLPTCLVFGKLLGETKNQQIVLWPYQHDSSCEATHQHNLSETTVSYQQLLVHCKECTT